MMVKDLLRELLMFFRLDLTKNLKYDRETRKIMKHIIKEDSNCIDIGCFKGEILKSIIGLAPKGHHYAFEPIPDMYQKLKKSFIKNCSIYPYALSDQNGNTTFQYVKNAPAYSGIRKRKYDVTVPEIEEIRVEMKKLDDVINPNTTIEFIKIDVEGGEFDVLKGGINLLKTNKPVVVFEFGLGASDYYGTKPTDFFDFIVDEIGLNIYSFGNYLTNKNHLTREEFIQYYNNNKEYYFIAST